MKKIKIIKEILMCIVLIMCIFLMLEIKEQNHYDLNKDGKVDSADLLLLRQYLIQEGK